MLVRLPKQQLGPFGDRLADGLRQHGGVLAQQFLGGHIVALVSFAHGGNGHAGEGLDFAGVQPHGPGPFHGLQHLVEHLVDHKDFFFGDAEQVIVVGTALDDGASGPVQVGRFVDHHRGIAGTGDDGPFAAVQRRSSHGGAAGNADHFDAAVSENGVGRFQGRFRDHADQVVDPQIAVDRLVEPPHPLGRHSFATGMRVDHQRITARDHADRIAGQRGQGVGDGGDAADHAKRSVFDDRQPMIAAEHLGIQKLHPRCPLAQRLQFLDLVLQPPDFRFFHLHCAQLDALVDGNPPNVPDNPLAVFPRPLAQLFKRRRGRRHGLVHVGKHTPATLVAGAVTGAGGVGGRAAVAGRGGGKGGGFQLAEHLLDDVADLVFSNLHG